MLKPGRVSRLLYSRCGTRKRKDFLTGPHSPSSLFIGQEGEAERMMVENEMHTLWVAAVKTVDSWEGFALLGFAATWESSWFSKSHFMALSDSCRTSENSLPENGHSRALGYQVAMALGFMMKRYRYAHASSFYYRWVLSLKMSSLQCSRLS